jgi:hypothetical protein
VPTRPPSPRSAKERREEGPAAAASLAESLGSGKSTTRCGWSASSTSIGLLRSGRESGGACPQPLRAGESVNHVSGMIRKPCARNGPKAHGAPRGIRTPDPQVRSLVLYPAELSARSRVDTRDDFRSPRSCAAPLATRARFVESQRCGASRVDAARDVRVSGAALHATRRCREACRLLLRRSSAERRRERTCRRR